MKKDLKTQAIKLRREGNSYSEILAKVPVAKSTLSLWLQDVSMSKHQRQLFTEKKRLASFRGGQARRDMNVALTRGIFEKTNKDIKSISKQELFLIGVILYWAEGNKEKDGRYSGGVRFNNSDARMVGVFVRWLREICHVSTDNIYFEIYIHRGHKNHLDIVKKHWARATGCPVNVFRKVYYKDHNPKTNRRKVGDLYYGLLRVKVRNSSVLLRQITGWTEAIVNRIARK